MKLQLDDRDLRCLEELARREGKTAEELAAEIFHDALAARKQNGAWLDEVAGSLEDTPEFDEVARLGKELRAADRPGSEG